MKAKKRTKPISSVDFKLPSSWKFLTQEQLKYYFFLKSEGYNDIVLQTYCFYRWSNLRFLAELPGERYSFLIKRNGKNSRISIDLEDLHWIVHKLDFLSEDPNDVIFLKEINEFKAIDPYLRQIPFSEYLSCENNYQGYLYTQNKKYLNKLASILYRNEVNNYATGIELTDIDTLAVIMWWYSYKIYLSNKFSYLFTKGEGATSIDIEGAMNGQIRALTGGDITKEKEVLSFNTYRALTELNEKAREVEELKKRYEK